MQISEQTALLQYDWYLGLTDIGNRPRIPIINSGFMDSPVRMTLKRLDWSASQLFLFSNSQWNDLRYPAIAGSDVNYPQQSMVSTV